MIFLLHVKWPEMPPYKLLLTYDVWRIVWRHAVASCGLAFVFELPWRPILGHQAWSWITSMITLNSQKKQMKYRKKLSHRNTAPAESKVSKNHNRLFLLSNLVLGFSYLFISFLGGWFRAITLASSQHLSASKFSDCVSLQGGFLWSY